MNTPLVMKFGGTSVADAAAMTNVMGIVANAAARPGPVLVVVSAMSGVTDGLLAACRVARDSGIDQADQHVARLESRHHAVVKDLFGDDAIAREISSSITATFDDLRGVLTSVAILQELTPR